MNRFLGFGVLLVLLALLLAIGIRQDPGYVLISWGHASVEMGLFLAALLWLGSLWLVVRLVALERWLFRLGRSDWSRFFGLSARKARTSAQEIGEKHRPGAPQA